MHTTVYWWRGVHEHYLNVLFSYAEDTRSELSREPTDNEAETDLQLAAED